MPSLPRSGPSLGGVLLLVLLVIVLVSGGGEEGDRGGDRGEGQAGAERERDAGGSGRPDAGDEGARAGDGRESGGRDTDGRARDDGNGHGSGPAEPPPDGVIVRVLRAVDGDTIEVLFHGHEEYVRYIGVDTPESVSPGQPVECFGKRASDFNAGLVAGEQVGLVFDAERRDYYNRLLAYVYLADGGRFVNAALVRKGFARILTIAPNDSLADVFARLQQAAGNAGRGLWGACGP